MAGARLGRVCPFPNTNRTLGKRRGRVRCGENKRAVAWEFRGPGGVRAAPLRDRDLAETLLLSEPHFSSSGKWGHTGETWIIASHPGVHISRVLSPVPGRRPRPRPAESEPRRPSETNAPGGPQRHPRLPFRLRSSACQGAVSTARRSNQQPRCREGGLDRQTAQVPQALVPEPAPRTLWPPTSRSFGGYRPCRVILDLRLRVLGESPQAFTPHTSC